MSIEKDAEGNEVEVPESEKTVDELVEEIAKLKENLTNVVEETKTIRKDRAEAREKIKVLEEELSKREAGEEGSGDENNDVESIVEKVLEKKEASKAETNKKLAFEKFVAENKIFSPENDPTGLKREALENKMKMFNTSGLVEIKDFYSVIKDSANLLGYVDTKPKTPEEGDGYNPYSSTPDTPPNPTISKQEDLTKKELDLIAEKGWTKEKYLKLKEKMPEYFATL